MPGTIRLYLLLCMLAWPLFASFIVFLADNPQGGGQVALVYYLIYSTWLYPVTLVASMVVQRREEMRTQRPKLWALLRWSPFLSALPYQPFACGFHSLLALGEEFVRRLST